MPSQIGIVPTEVSVPSRTNLFTLETGAKAAADPRQRAMKNDLMSTHNKCLNSHNKMDPPLFLPPFFLLLIL